MFDRSLGVRSAAAPVLDMQYEALEALCESYNSRVELSSMRFYPKGGSLYRLFWVMKQYKKYGKLKDTMPACYETGDVDGVLLIVPRPFSNEMILDFIGSEIVETEDVYSYTNVNVEDIQLAAKEAYDKVFNKPDAELWLRGASSGEYELRLPENAFIEVDKTKMSFSELNALNGTSLFEQLPIYNEFLFDPGYGNYGFYTNPLGLTIRYDGANDDLDVHLAFLEPPTRDNDYTMLMECILDARPMMKSSIYLIPQKHFFIDQFRLMFERLSTYYKLAVVDNNKFEDRRLTEVLSGKMKMGHVKDMQSVLKAEKTLCRVEAVSNDYSTLVLRDLYEWRKQLPFQNKKYLQSTRLKKFVEDFNSMFDWSDDMIQDDMTVGQIILVMRHFFDATKHIGSASIGASRHHLFAESARSTMLYRNALRTTLRF